MRETNWFEERGVDERLYERCYWRRIGFAAFVLIMVSVIAVLSGCASSGPEQKVCYMQFLGKTENGWTVAALSCLTPEEFAAAQK